MKPEKRAYFLLAIAITAGMFGAIRIGEIAAKHVMHIGPQVTPPGGLQEAEARAKAEPGNERWWADSFEKPSPSPLPLARLPDQTDRPDQVGSSQSSQDDRKTAVSLAPVERTVRISKGDTLMDLLLNAGVPGSEAHDAIDAIRDVFDPRGIKPGLALTLTFGSNDTSDDNSSRGRLMKVSLPLADKTIEVQRNRDDEFSASKIARPLTREVVRTQGTIHSSLYEDGIASGLPAPLLAELIHAFSYDVDFQREIQPGDRFEVAFERYTDGKARVIKTGNLVYASLTLSGRTLKVYRYRPKGGVADYFNEKGESVRKALLRTPIDGARLTSGFGVRLHPILGYSKMHKGVDFGAAAGTPIMAAGDGVVEMAGWNHGYGNYVRIRHNSQYSTAYAHMSKIARGIRPGSHIHQGQVIGYVGSTGLATGPHLHYEVLVHNAQINPLSVKLPTGIKLAGAALKAFEQAKAQTDSSLVSLPEARKVATTAF